MKRVCVFCGSSEGSDPVYREAARQMGEVLAGRGLVLVYGGGGIGLMKVLADAMLARGGEVVGIMPEPLMAKELAHTGLTDLRIVGSMHERKALMAELSDAFVALPGGYGTLEEFCEVLTWAQLGIHRKPCGLLNVNGYFDPLRELFDRFVREGFLSSANRTLVVEARAPDALLDALARYRSPVRERWVAQDET
jgi:uncharacterized protein (TIGR00730 family)